MDSIWKSPIIRNVLVALFFLPSLGMAADFELFWDPNCNADPTLEGYSIHYRENGSVIAAPEEATTIYVALIDIGFDPSQPSCLVSGLMDDTLYCFTVSASYEDEDSVMSNGICGMNGGYAPSPASAPTVSSSGGCFIKVLE
jgi:hypothetical protein